MRYIYFDASKCPECGSDRISFNEKRAEFFCRNCGFVLMDNIPVIEATHGEIEKVLVNPKQKKIAVVIKGILKTKIEKKMAPFYAEIKKFNLPKHMEAEVLMLAKRTVELKLTMSWSKMEILSALIYSVCKREGMPVMIKELEKIYGVDKKTLLQCLKMLVSKLGIRAVSLNTESYMIRIASDLGYNGKLATKAIEISRKLNISHPLLMAAVSIWLAAKEINIKLKKKTVAKASEVSEAALRKNIKIAGGGKNG
jgi:transcription initiation factor TFIIB